LDTATAKDVVLASSSSGLLMSEIQKATARPERCLIAHPFNPPYLVPLVELVPGKSTAPETIIETKQFFESLGKTPVVLNKETPGHIANRLAAALWREAIDLVLKGVASVEDVDKAVSAGPGLRWAIMGQHMIYHLGGGQGGLAAFIDHLTPALEMWWNDLADWKMFPSEAREQLLAGVDEEMAGRDLSEVMRWRDEKLVQVLKALQD
jgi:3-hydroxyacyl-CoA dehydrogenase